jgi:hypothetical protein
MEVGDVTDPNLDGDFQALLEVRQVSFIVGFVVVLYRRLKHFIHDCLKIGQAAIDETHIECCLVYRPTLFPQHVNMQWTCKDEQKDLNELRPQM